MLSIHWFRRDLRLEDNASLYHALRAGLKVQPIFIFDKNILGQLDNTEDARVNFIYQNLVSLNSQLAEYGSSLKVYYGKPLEVWLQIIQEIKPSKVFANSDYEPIAIKRDHEISLLLEQYQITFETFKDQCIFEKSEVVKDDGKPYTVFTPYSRKWKAKLQEFHLKSYPTEKNFQNFAPSSFTIPAIETYGFKTLKYSFPALETTRAIIKNYQQQRAFTADEIHMFFLSLGNPGYIESIKAGKMKVMFFGGDKRNPIITDAPTMAESGVPDHGFKSWWGMAAPKGTPKEIIDRLHTAFIEALRTPAIQQRFATMSLDIAPSTPAEFGKFMLEDRARGERLVKSSGARLD